MRISLVSVLTIGLMCFAQLSVEAWKHGRGRGRGPAWKHGRGRDRGPPSGHRVPPGHLNRFPGQEDNLSEPYFGPPGHRKRPEGHVIGGPPGRGKRPSAHVNGPPGHQKIPPGHFNMPPGHYKRKTIDQLIVEAYGGLDAANDIASEPNKGLITAELDMNLTPEQYSGLYGIEERQKRKAFADVRARWSDNVIPYELAAEDFTAEEVKEIRETLSVWEELTCLRFRPYTASDRNRIRLQNGRGCNSALGMIGGTQGINLQTPGCRHKGLYFHEVGHAIGLVHEHQLPQRDSYITIKLSNVALADRQWFHKYVPQFVDLQGVEYDYSSVMHYGKTAFSHDGEAQTIFAKDASKEAEIGHVAFKSLSFSDVKAVNFMYKCNESCTTLPPCEAPCFVDKHCKCFCQEDMPKPPCVNKGNDTLCQGWAEYGQCTTNPDYMHDYCKKACALCEEENAGRTRTDGCNNTYDDQKCAIWAARGECEKNPSWMTSNCRLSCDKCGQPETGTTPISAMTTESTTTELRSTTQSIAADVSCRDRASGCPSWKMYCSSNTYVIENCLKTCNRCNQT